MNNPRDWSSACAAWLVVGFLLVCVAAGLLLMGLVVLRGG